MKDIEYTDIISSTYFTLNQKLYCCERVNYFYNLKLLRFYLSSTCHFMPHSFPFLNIFLLCHINISLTFCNYIRHKQARETWETSLTPYELPNFHKNAISTHSVPVGSQTVLLYGDRSTNLPSVLDESARSSVSFWHQPSTPSPEPEHSFAIRFMSLIPSRGGTSLVIQVNCVSVHAWIFHPPEVF